VVKPMASAEMPARNVARVSGEREFVLFFISCAPHYPWRREQAL